MAQMRALHVDAAWLKPLVVAGSALAVMLGLVYLKSPESTRIKVGMLAPELDLPNVGPGTLKLSSFRGKPVLLAFFMADCELCAKEVPQIELVHREFRLKNLIVLGVAVDRDYAARESFLKSNNVSFGILTDPNGDAVYRAFGSYKMPEAYLIDASGRVAAVWLGAVNWRSPEVRQKLLDVLPSPAKASRP
jgi:peroxiredoxin